MGLVLNHLYKLSPGNQDKAAGVIIIGGTGTTIYGSQEIPSEFANMADLNNGTALTAGYYTFSVLPEYLLFDGDATSIQLVGMSFKDTEIVISA